MKKKKTFFSVENGKKIIDILNYVSTWENPFKKFTNNVLFESNFILYETTIISIFIVQNLNHFLSR